MDWEYSSPLANALLATNASTGIRPSTFFDPLYTDFEPITNRNFQTTTNYLSPGIGTLSNQYLTSDILLNSNTTNTNAPLLAQAYNSTVYPRNSINNFNNQYVPSQLQQAAQQQLINKNGKKGDLNININVEGTPENPYPNSILAQQHQYMLQKQALQNQYFNNQRQLKGGLGNQQFPNQPQNNDSLNDYNDLESFQKTQQQLLFSNRYGNENNNNNNNNGYETSRRNQNGEDNSITSTDAEPIPSASPLSRRKNGNIHEKLYQEAFDNSGSYLTAMKEAKNRERRLAKRQYSQSDYKIYEKNFGFGKGFLPFEAETKEEKAEKAKIRNDYAKQIKERNTIIIDEQRRYRDLNPLFIPKRAIEFDASKRNRDPYPMKNQAGVLSKGMKEFEKQIREEHDANCTCGFHDHYLTTSPNSYDASSLRRNKSRAK